MFLVMVLGDGGSDLTAQGHVVHHSCDVYSVLAIAKAEDKNTAL